MKKLLSLLSVLTISGTALPTTIAASPYQKEEQNNNHLIEIIFDNPNINITVVKILDKNTCGGNLNSGTTYVGTDNGVYLIYPNGKNAYRFNDLNFAIKDIILDGNGSAYVENNKGEFYHLNLYGWGSLKLEDVQILNLLKDWNKDYDKWKNEFNRQIKEDVPNFSESQKRTWKDDKNFQLRTQISLLKDKVNIIKNHNDINKINNIVLNLKNKINQIYENIDNLSKRRYIIKEELDKNSNKTCELDELMENINNLFSSIPVFSTLTGALKSITTISCKIFKL